ncbi:MAG: T9SS type A sorting domain-containing protein, partial [Flavobacteriales bacterium]|nr:T9SS type A sorting domain-containing protein [Flavobacteriales bacterium]
NGDAVITGGIVTGVDTIGADAYFIQAGTGPWSGVYVYDQAHAVALGDSVELTAVVDEFSGATTELTNVSAFSIIGNYPLPAPQLLDTQGATEEQWEGVLAIIANAACTTLPDGFGEWGITQPSGAYLVDDLMYAYTPEVGTSYDITGCIHYANGAWKIEPRFPADIVEATSISENLFDDATLGPNPATDVLRVHTGLPVGTRVQFTLTDALGRIVNSGQLNGIGTLDVQELTTGLYHLTLRTGNGAKSFTVEVR